MVLSALTATKSTTQAAEKLVRTVGRDISPGVNAAESTRALAPEAHFSVVRHKIRLFSAACTVKIDYGFASRNTSCAGDGSARRPLAEKIQKEVAKSYQYHGSSVSIIATIWPPDLLLRPPFLLVGNELSEGRGRRALADDAA